MHSQYILIVHSLWWGFVVFYREQMTRNGLKSNVKLRVENDTPLWDYNANGWLFKCDPQS